MKSAKKKRKLLPRKKAVKRTIKAKPAPRKRRKSRMSNIKKPIADEDPKPAGGDPMGKPADSPPNPNLPPEEPSKTPPPPPPQPPRPSPLPAKE